MGADENQQLEEERLCKTLDVLTELHMAGFYEHADFLAAELRVKQWWHKPEAGHAANR